LVPVRTAFKRRKAKSKILMRNSGIGLTRR
jgi:hypothetical protein